MEQGTLAQVIVDVPSSQTNVPFTYKIPKGLLNVVKKGMRVLVPFGPRKIQGYVIGFTDHSKYHLRNIISVMDTEPVLNNELLQLSKQLASDTYSFRIDCLKAMLPSAMNARYSKKATLVHPVNDTRVKRLFHNNEFIYKPKRITHTQSKLLAQLRRKNLIQIDYLVGNQAHALKISVFKSLLTSGQAKKQLQHVNKRAVGQITLLKLIMKNPKHVFVMSSATKRYKHLSSSVVTAGAKKHWVKRYKANLNRNPYKLPVKPNQPFVLNHDQQRALQNITRSIYANRPRVFLLEGVTGSGKTEVYLQAISQALRCGKTALMLVPEIALTPQIVNWFKGRFGNLIAILHSGLSEGERYDEWRRIKSGKARIVVGVRSAVFAPLKNIGVIIMDEEHDMSYKQESDPRYQTRVVAKWRSKYHNCPVVLGSATPSLESRARAGKGVYKMLRLPHRINGQSLPTVHIVDMRKKINRQSSNNFSFPLLQAIRQRMQNHEQTILMLNRRGYSAHIKCKNCGYVPKCPNCDVTLTLHLKAHKLECHYCGFQTSVPNICPRCHSNELQYKGTGTERAEMELKQLIPGVKVIRMDTDTTRKKGAHARLLREFRHGDANVLLGTQMIAKGLDFPNVTLVGVLNADTTLEVSDYRADEWTFQLLTQVSGRAGRAGKKGEVFVQTYHPKNKAIRLAQQQNYEKFYHMEMKYRHAMMYPPYCYIIRVASSSKDFYKTQSEIMTVKGYLQHYLSNKTLLLGPTISNIAKIKGYYYYQLIIKYTYEPYLHACLEFVLHQCQKDSRKGVYTAINVNPTDTL